MAPIIASAHIPICVPDPALLQPDDRACLAGFPVCGAREGCEATEPPPEPLSNSLVLMHGEVSLVGARSIVHDCRSDVGFAGAPGICTARKYVSVRCAAADRRDVCAHKRSRKHRRITWALTASSTALFPSP
jgi:hypothetical protein